MVLFLAGGAAFLVLLGMPELVIIALCGIKLVDVCAWMREDYRQRAARIEFLERRLREIRGF